MRAALASCILLALAAPAAMANDHISYSYLEADWTQIDADDLDDESGWSLRGSGEISEHFYVFGDYSTAEFDGFGGDVDVSLWDIGLGWHTPLSDMTDFLIEGGYMELEADSRFGSADDGGAFGNVGLRMALAPSFELTGKVGYFDLGSDVDGFQATLAGLIKLTPNWGINLQAQSLDGDDELYSAGLRYSF